MGVIPDILLSVVIGELIEDGYGSYVPDEGQEQCLGLVGNDVVY
jgi:hypothetical protein